MSVENIGSGYIFVVDTEEYAGNFEREMCAYATGMTGECGVGYEGAKQYAEDMSLELDGHCVLDNQFEDVVQNVTMDVIAQHLYGPLPAGSITETEATTEITEKKKSKH
jgi:hypothetical protein